MRGRCRGSGCHGGLLFGWGVGCLRLGVVARHNGLGAGDAEEGFCIVYAGLVLSVELVAVFILVRVEEGGVVDDTGMPQWSGCAEDRFLSAE